MHHIVHHKIVTHSERPLVLIWIKNAVVKQRLGVSQRLHIIRVHACCALQLLVVVTANSTWVSLETQPKRGVLACMYIHRHTHQALHTHTCMYYVYIHTSSIVHTHIHVLCVHTHIKHCIQTHTCIMCVCSACGHVLCMYVCT